MVIQLVEFANTAAKESRVRGPLAHILSASQCHNDRLHHSSDGLILIHRRSDVGFWFNVVFDA
jgi:hypothetical protein